jgi:hypothetical protein
VRQLSQDLRYGLRMLGRNPAWALVIVASLAIGIGANSAVFSVADALFLKPLPYPQPDRLVNLWWRSPATGAAQEWLSLGDCIHIQTQNHVFEEMAIAMTGAFNLTGIETPERIEGVRASSSLLRLLGAKPMLGRLILPEDDKPGKPTVALLTHGLWRRLFGASPFVAGKSIHLDGEPITVAGVLPPEFLLNNEIMPKRSRYGEGGDRAIAPSARGRGSR